MSSNKQENLDAALQYATLGWRVFPCHTIKTNGQCSCDSVSCGSPGKHPRTPKGLTDATTDADVIRDWWTKWPNANVAIVTGRESGLIVLDVDPRHGGDDALDHLLAKHGKWSDTTEAITGGGGQHALFRHPGGKIKSGPLCYCGKATGRRNDCTCGLYGLDLKGDGGYIIAPPSRHVSGNSYVWDGLDLSFHLAQPPAWLTALIEKPRKPKESPKTPKLDSQIVAGARNSTLASYGGSLRRIGLTASEVEAALLAMNQGRCEPPLSRDEVAQIAQSMGRYSPDQAVAAVPARLQISNAASLLAQKFDPLAWVIDKTVPTGITLNTGRPKSGKSWLALQMAIAAAEGLLALGKFKATPCKVLYIALEDTPRRIQQRLKTLKCDLVPPENLHFAHILPKLSKGGVAAVEEAIQANGFRFVIIDTLVAASAAERPRDAFRADYAEIAGLKAVADRNGTAIMLVHHTRKQPPNGQSDEAIDRVMGTTGVTAAADSILVLGKRGDAPTLEVISRDTDGGQFALNFDPASGLGWSVVGNTPPAPVKGVAGQILKLLDKTGPLLPLDIAERLSRNPSTVRGALMNMVGLGKIYRRNDGKYDTVPTTPTTLIEITPPTTTDDNEV